MKTVSEKLPQARHQRPLSMKLIVRLFRNLGPWIWLLVAGNILCLICAATDMAIIREVRHIIDTPDKKTVSLLALVGPLGVMCLINRVTGWGQWLLTLYSVNRAVERIRIDFFTKLTTLSKSFFNTHKAGWLIARNTGDIFQINNFLTFALMMTVYFSTAITFAFIEMFRVSPVLLAPTVIMLPVVIFSTRRYQNKMSRAQRDAREQNSRLVANLSENVRGVRVVQAFSRQQHNFSRFEKLNRKSREMELRVSRLNAFFLPSIDFLGIFNTIIVITFAALLNQGLIPFFPKISFSSGILIQYISYMNIIVWPIRMLLEMYSTAMAAMAAAERIYEIMDTPPEIEDRPDAPAITVTRGEIALTDVTFSYTPDTPPVLKELNLTIPPGKTFALVGETGAGKTTIGALIARFFDPTEGTVTIDGTDIASVTQKSLHRSMGIVLQEGFLFSGTVLENIGFAAPTLSRAELIDCAQQLGTHESILSLANGYDTIIREGGRSLSAGQRQLICLTRALAADPAILILDEPTSSLDIQTERILQQALERLCADRTTVIIAHRLSTIRNADTICVIDKGAIVEQGTHETLLARNGRYHSLVRRIGSPSDE